MIIRKKFNNNNIDILLKLVHQEMGILMIIILLKENWENNVKHSFHFPKNLKICYLIIILK